MKKPLVNLRRLGVAILFITGTISALFGLPAYAELPKTGPTAKVTFTFDDGLASSYNAAAPTLSKYGLSGTVYVATGCVGMTTAPNTCRANNDAKYLSWQQIKTLQSQYGWEIGSHTVTHPYLATYDVTDGQAQPLTPEQVSREIIQSKADLSAQGINATAFAFPYGDYNNSVRQLAAKYYSSQRGFADQNANIWPYNDTLLNNMQVQAGVQVTAVKAKIDAAIANRQWLILTMHDVLANPSRNAIDYQYATKDLDSIAAYVKQKQDAGLLKSTNITPGLVSGPSNNLIASGSFSQGLAGGWTTDTPGSIQADSGQNGSYPEARNSVKFTSTTKNAHLFSPKVKVARGQKYLLRSYLNVQRINSGEVGFYIDEYDANGNWVSGQYKAREPSSFVEYISMSYQPSSVMVASASLQVFVTAGANAVAYLDDVQWYATDTVPVTDTNLMPNGSFDAGFGSWNTDNSSVMSIDQSNMGSPDNPKNAVAVNAGSTDRDYHLFSPRIPIDSASQYYLQNYVNITSRQTGEIGFYIDEYDSSGMWVSGQYKTAVASIGQQDVGIRYQPSSANVKSASLQVIIATGSNLTAYVDDSRWWKVQ